MRRNIRAMRALIITAVAALWTMSMATAQPVFTNPPCPVVNVSNITPVPVQFNAVTIPAGVWPPIVVPPGGIVPLPVPAGGVTVLGVVSCAGVIVPFNAPPPPAGWVPPCNPWDWWIPSIALPPTCRCFNICLDTRNCRILIWGPTPPPCLNP